MSNNNIKQTHDNIIKGIRDYFKKSSYKKAVIGLSGGIDSSVSCTLAAKALSSSNVTGLIMPQIGLSSMEHYKDAIDIAKLNKIKYFIVPINSFLSGFTRLKWKESKFANMNVKARIRAVILYHYANSQNALVIGTSNKTELLLGYFTKYGDGAVDIEVIGDLYKKEVVEMAKFLKLPEQIITKAPSAELFHGHTDESEIGASYAEIDNILISMEHGKDPKGKIAEKIKKLMKQNRHKTLPIPLVKKG